MTEIACPLGDHAGSVQRVSAIFSAGTSTSLTSQDASQTLLAGLLAPPTEPKLRNAWGGRARPLFWGWAVFGVVPVAAVIGSVGATFFGLQAHANPDALDKLLIGLSVVIWIAITVVAYRRITGSQRRYRVQFEARHKHWEDWLGYWARVYYCHKDGIVFDPASPTMYSVGDFRETMDKV